MYYALAKEERLGARARRRTIRAMTGTGVITLLMLSAVLVSSTKDLGRSMTPHGPLTRFFAWVDPAFMTPQERGHHSDGPAAPSEPIPIPPKRATPAPSHVSWRTV
jgi:hypothetical protein